MAVAPRKKRKAASAKADDGEAVAEVSDEMGQQGEDVTTKAEKKDTKEDKKEAKQEAAPETETKGKKRVAEAKAEPEPGAESEPLAEAAAGKKKKKKVKAIVIDPESLPEPKFYRVAVRGHPMTAKKSELEAFFEEKCGEVKRVQIMEGRHRGLAFVEFAGRKGFNKALKLVGEKFGDSDKSLKISPSKSEVAGKDEADDQPRRKKTRNRIKDRQRHKAVRSRQKAGGEAEGSADKQFEVFVGSLPYGTLPSKIKEDIGEKCGPSVNFVIPQLKNSKKHKGIAFIQFASEEGVDKALALSGTEYGGMKLRVERSVKKQKQEGEEGGGGRGGSRDGGHGGGRGGRGRGVKRKAEGRGSGKPESDGDE